MSRLSYVILSVCDIFCQNGGISFFLFVFVFVFGFFVGGFVAKREYYCVSTNQKGHEKIELIAV